MKQKKNWNSQNNSRKNVQKSYNRKKEEIERKNNNRSVKRWFKPRVIHHKNIFENHRASVATTTKNIMIADIIVSPNSEYKRLKMIEENLKTFKKSQSEILQKIYKKLSLSQQELIDETSIMNSNKLANVILIFETITNYNDIMYKVDRDIPITEDSASRLDKYYISMKKYVNNYVLSFIQYICNCLEFHIFELLWGFCLPNNSITKNEYILQIYSYIDDNISLLEGNLKECKKRYEADPDFEPFNLEKLNHLYELLNRIQQIKLNGNTWNGEYLTEDEIYRHCIDTVPSIMIDELDAYLTPMIHKFPYDDLTPLESEIIKSVLLLKIKENQPRTIHIDDNMVMPKNYWTEAIPIQGTRF
jgi:glutaredoxin